MNFLSILAFCVACCSIVRGRDLLIASFNVQVLGQSKVQDQAVVDQLVKIISRYDLVLIQEIRDKSGTAIVEVFDQVNRANNNVYSYVISDRLGRTTSKEQYCYIYKTDYFTVVDEYVYSDPGDVFEREPFNVRFKVANWAQPDLVVSAIHTKPEDAVAELSRMVYVYEDIVDRWGIENVLIMGDFNADCSYVGKTKWPQVELRTDERFKWYITDDDDTTVRESTHCAYDRFAIAGKGLQDSVQSARVFNFEREYGLAAALAEMVSDHYPIEMSIVTAVADEYKEDNGHNHSNQVLSDYLSWLLTVVGSVYVSQ